VPALTSGRYEIEWTRLSDLPVPLYGAYVAVKDQTIYVAGHDSPVVQAKEQVYAYDITSDHWSQLPIPGQYYGIPHIIGDKLSIIGGRLSSTGKQTNRVVTFDEATNTWISYYPNLLSTRSRPGVISHLEHVIVAGGVTGDEHDNVSTVLEDIEILNWLENSQWKKASVHLPEPMYGFTPIICNDSLFILGYCTANKKCSNGAYKIAVDDITLSSEGYRYHKVPIYEEFTIFNWDVTPVSTLSPPVIAGGCGADLRPTADILIYDYSSIKVWSKIGSLSFARTETAIAVVSNNAIVVIGGCTSGKYLSITPIITVELGHVVYTR